MVSHSQCKVVSRAFLHPPIKKCPYVRFEVPPRIGISRRWNGSCYGLAFGNDEFELAFIGRTYAEHRNRTLFDFELNTRTGTVLPMVFFKTTQYRLALGDRDIMRTIVSYQDKILQKINGMEFRKTSAYFQPIHNQHRDACFQIGFAAHGKSARRQEDRKSVV